MTIDNPSSNTMWNEKRGIHLLGVSNCIIIDNFITNCDYGAGIWLYQASNNLIKDNTVENGADGISLGLSTNNNVINNNYTIGDPGFIYHYPSKLSINIWDDGYDSGNFWDDYFTRYPNATESNTPGVGDTPYFIRPASYIDPADVPTQESKEYWTNMNAIYAQNVDHYPLMAPYGSNTTMPQDELIPTTIAIAASITIAIIVLVVALIVYMNRRK